MTIAGSHLKWILSVTIRQVIYEWIDISATDEHIGVAKALSNSVKSTIRFQGNQYHSDKQLADDQKEGIRKILKLYKLMKSA